MQRQSIASSNIATIGWEATDVQAQMGVLEVEFKGGEVYQYSNVPQSVYQELLQSPSAGRTLRDAMRGYDYERIE
jgi:hypothetical protein